jgi:hypothetical protein
VDEKLYERAIKEHGRRWQVLEAVVEMCEYSVITPIAARDTIPDRLGIDRREVDEALYYWHRKGYIDVKNLLVFLKVEGLDVFTQAAYDLVYKGSSVRPILILEELRDGKITPRTTALLKGLGRFDGVHHPIGISQLLFLHLLFVSKDERDYGQGIATWVSEDEVVERLIRWSDKGFKRLSDRDRERPRDRVRREWSSCVKRIEKQVPALAGMFRRVAESAAEEHVFYGIALPFEALRSDVRSLDRVAENTGDEESAWDKEE